MEDAPVSDDAPVAAPTDAPAGPSIGRRLLRALLAILASFALAGLSFELFTRNNDFPLLYHPDEWGKVNQVASPTSERNFRHPLLLLESAEIATHVLKTPVDDERQVAIAGRTASAFLASVGVFAAALLGFAVAGWVGLAIVGPTVALCPPLLVYAHYLKEDATLAGGLGVATLGVGLVLTTRRALPQLGAAIVLGLGCAMAASGKYIGAAAAAPALLAVVVAPLARWWQWPIRVGAFALVAVVAAVAINARAFEDPFHLTLKQEVVPQFDWEYHHGTTGHSGIALPVPNAFDVRVALSETMPHLLAMATIGAIAWLAVTLRARRWPLSRLAIVLALLPVTFAIVLSHNTIPFERYALPLTFFAYVLAALTMSAGVVAIGRTHRRASVAIAATTAIVVVLAQGRRCLDFDRRFADDSRERLREWLATNATPGALVVSDWFSDLYNDGDPCRFPNQADVTVRVINRGYASEAGGSVDQLARRGVTYVVAVGSSYSRFLVDGIQPIEPGEADWLRETQHFYLDLFARGQLVWSNLPNPVANGYVDPEIRVYRIDQLRPSNVPPPLTTMERWMKEMERRRKALATRPTN